VNPEFPHFEGLRDYVIQHLNLPMTEKSPVLSFDVLVQENGKLSNIRLEETEMKDTILAKKVKYILENMPHWTPAIKAGKPLKKTIKIVVCL
jgi:hypothetical protein